MKNVDVEDILGKILVEDVRYRIEPDGDLLLGRGDFWQAYFNINNIESEDKLIVRSLMCAQDLLAHIIITMEKNTKQDLKEIIP